MFLNIELKFKDKNIKITLINYEKSLSLLIAQ